VNQSVGVHPANAFVDVDPVIIVSLRERLVVTVRLRPARQRYPREELVSQLDVRPDPQPEPEPVPIIRHSFAGVNTG